MVDEGEVSTAAQTVSPAVVDGSSTKDDDAANKKTNNNNNPEDNPPQKPNEINLLESENVSEEEEITILTASSPLMSLSSWPSSSVHGEASARVLSVICGNTRCHWALHDPVQSTFTPILFWKTTPPLDVLPDETSDPTKSQSLLLTKFLPTKALEMIGGPDFEKDRSLSSLVKYITKQRIPYFHVYIISTNAQHSAAIPTLFASLPCRIVQLQAADFLTSGYKGLGVDRCACLYAAGQFFGHPALVIDGGTALTWTASDDQGQFRGGGIAPGIGVKFRSLHDHTGALPMIDYLELREVVQQVILKEKPLSNYATSTREAILVGVLRETAISLSALVRNWVAGIRRKQKEHEFTDLHVVVTGGDSWLLAKLLEPRFSNILEEEDGDVTPLSCHGIPRLKIMTQTNLGNHGIAALLKQKASLIPFTSKLEQIRQELLGQRVIMPGTVKTGSTTSLTGDKQSQGSGAAEPQPRLRATIYDIQRTNSLLKDKFKIKYDDGSEDILKAEDLYDRLMEFSSLGETYDDFYLPQRKQIQDNAKKAAENLGSHIPSVAARMKAAAEELAAASKRQADNELPSAVKAKRVRNTPDHAKPSPDRAAKPAIVITKKMVLADPQAYVTRRVAKYFGKILYFGTVVYFIPPAENEDEGLWHIQYDDGDNEDYYALELAKFLKLYSQHESEDNAQQPK